jgi:hypothetical protein
VAVGVADDEARLLLLGVRLSRAFAAELRFLLNARKRGQGEKFKNNPKQGSPASPTELIEYADPKSGGPEF